MPTFQSTFCPYRSLKPVTAAVSDCLLTTFSERIGLAFTNLSTRFCLPAASQTKCLPRSSSAEALVEHHSCLQKDSSDNSFIKPKGQILLFALDSILFFNYVDLIPNELVVQLYALFFL